MAPHDLLGAQPAPIQQPLAGLGVLWTQTNASSGTSGSAWGGGRQKGHSERGAGPNLLLSPLQVCIHPSLCCHQHSQQVQPAFHRDNQHRPYSYSISGAWGGQEGGEGDILHFIPTATVHSCGCGELAAWGNGVDTAEGGQVTKGSLREGSQVEAGLAKEAHWPAFCLSLPHSGTG